MQTKRGEWAALKQSSPAAEIKALSPKRGRRGALPIYETLREEILCLHLAPGAPLDEMALAARFEVSRTPIREALLLLAGENLVEFLPNRTSIVANFSLDNSGDYLDAALIVSRAVARSAALSGRAEPGELKKLVRCYGRAVEANDWEAAMRCELTALRHLGSLSGNIFLIKFFEQALDAGRRARVLHYYPNATLEEMLGSVAGMQALMDAVQAGDADRSDSAIAEFMETASAIIARSLSPRFGAEMSLDSFGEGLSHA